MSQSTWELLLIISSPLQSHCSPVSMAYSSPIAKHVSKLRSSQTGVLNMTVMSVQQSTRRGDSHHGWSNCLMLLCQYAPESLCNVSSTLLNQCHKSLSQFWGQKGVQRCTSKVWLIKHPVSSYLCKVRTPHPLKLKENIWLVGKFSNH